jgi:hypothetical protein
MISGAKLGARSSAINNKSVNTGQYPDEQTD